MLVLVLGVSEPRRARARARLRARGLRACVVKDGYQPFRRRDGLRVLQGYSTPPGVDAVHGVFGQEYSKVELLLAVIPHYVQFQFTTSTYHFLEHQVEGILILAGPA